VRVPGSYIRPYHSKPSAALRRLREQVFAAGQYRKPATLQERLAQLGPLPLPSQVHGQTVEELRRALEAGATNSEETLILIRQAERRAEEAAKREPEYLRLMEALRAGTLDSLPEVQEWNARALQAFGPVPRAPVRPTRKGGSVSASIAKLLMRAGESGTHSILDITRVGKRAGHATASPLGPDRLFDIFATIEPTRAQVEATGLAFAEALHWQAVYLPCTETASRSSGHSSAVPGIEVVRQTQPLHRTAAEKGDESRRAAASGTARGPRQTGGQRPRSPPPCETPAAGRCRD
jgi:hypothetical protein